MIRPAPWQTRWAQLLLLCAAGLLVFLGLRTRSRAHQRRERALEELVDARTRQLQRANELLVDLSYVDALTSVPNRRRFDDLFQEEWQRCGEIGGAALAGHDRHRQLQGLQRHLRPSRRRRMPEIGRALPRRRSGAPRRRDRPLRRRGVRGHPAGDGGGGGAADGRAPAPACRAPGHPHIGVEGGPRGDGELRCRHHVPAVEQDPAELFRRADEALYRAKRAGGNATQTG